MHTHRLGKVSMCEHNAFRIAGRSRGIDNTGQIIERLAGNAAINQRFCFGSRNRTRYKIGKIYRRGIAFGKAYRTVEYDNPFQRRTSRQCLPCVVVLILLTDKQISDFGVAHDILQLFQRAGRIKRDNHRAIGISGKIDNQPFGLIRRIRRYIFLYPDTAGGHRKSRLSYLTLKRQPRDRHPFSRCIFIS